MAKGLFTSMEEICFNDMYVNANVPLVKSRVKDTRQIRKENQWISQNVKRLNQKAVQARMRMNSR